MTDLSGFAVGLVASLALHAALMVGAGALRGTAPADPELTPVEDEAVALDLANVDLSFSEEERDEAPVNPMPTAVPAVAEAVPPSPAAHLPEPPPLVVPPALDTVAVAKADDVRPTELRPQELEAPDAPPQPSEEPPPEPSKTDPPPKPAPSQPSAPPQAVEQAAAPAPVQARVDAPPAPRRAIRPKYPEEARRRREQGDVTVELAVDARGKVTDVKVVASCGFADLERAAVAAARNATFRPAKRGHKAVPAVARLTLTFRLRDGQ